MENIARNVADMVNMLPEDYQQLAFKLIQKLVLAWDPDFTKLTPSERKAMEIAEEEINRGETVKHDEINWD